MINIAPVAAPLSSGASTSANQTTELTNLGAVTETAPSTDTGSSGLNGRLQRVAQRLTSILSIQAPVTISGTLANSTPLVQAWPQVLANRTIVLKSSAGGRLIEFSVDGGTEYFTFTYDFTSATSLVVFVKVPITNIRITGTTNDTWSVL